MKQQNSTNQIAEMASSLLVEGTLADTAVKSVTGVMRLMIQAEETLIGQGVEQAEARDRVKRNFELCNQHHAIVSLENLIK